MSRRAVFLDRDGTINEDVGYPSRWDQVKVFSWSFEAVRKLKAAGFLVIVVTNQSGIGRGFLKEDEVGELHARLVDAFDARGARIDAVYHCPHDESSGGSPPEPGCPCRKPEPGMGRRAAGDLAVDLARSYMVGDKPEDMLFGRAIGAKPVLVLTGYGAASRPRLEAAGIMPAAVAENLGAAVDWILADERAAGA
jgi:D-glycero-D-manno-heptose 1,7-bisphosphate phosphatase